MKYRIEARVGCIAVVDESFNSDGRLSPNMEGVVAYWSGKYDFGWEVEEWQAFKAFRLCNLLNGSKPSPKFSAGEVKAHFGDPCIFCQTPHDAVGIGDCTGLGG